MRTEQPQPKHNGFTTFNKKLTIVSDNHLTSKQFKTPQSRDIRYTHAWQSGDNKKNHTTKQFNTHCSSE